MEHLLSDRHPRIASGAASPGRSDPHPNKPALVHKCHQDCQRTWNTISSTKHYFELTSMLCAIMVDAWMLRMDQFRHVCQQLVRIRCEHTPYMRVTSGIQPQSHPSVGRTRCYNVGIYAAPWQHVGTTGPEHIGSDSQSGASVQDLHLCFQCVTDPLPRHCCAPVPLRLVTHRLEVHSCSAKGTLD